MKKCQDVHVASLVEIMLFELDIMELCATRCHLQVDWLCLQL